MSINTLFRPIVAYMLLAIITGLIFSNIVAFFLPQERLSYNAQEKQNDEISFPVNKAFNLVPKKKKVVKVIKHNSKEYLLKAFNVTGIVYINDNNPNNLVIIRNSKGGIFLYEQEFYKKYQLIKVFPFKAKFKKGNDYYWVFLSPKDEKEFLKKGHASSAGGSNYQNTVPEFVTVARSMSSSIKYKNGKYFIPKELLENKKNIFKMFSSIRVVSYNINNKKSFKVNYLHRSSVFRKLGIHLNDQIIKINGEEIKSLSQPIEMFKNLNTIKQLTITIKRSGKIKELQYEVY